jgi:hypothetical protein
MVSLLASGPAMQKVLDGQTFPVTPSVGALVLAALEQ